MYKEVIDFYSKFNDLPTGRFPYKKFSISSLKEYNKLKQKLEKDYGKDFRLAPLIKQLPPAWILLRYVYPLISVIAFVAVYYIFYSLDIPHIKTVTIRGESMDILFLLSLIVYVIANIRGMIYKANLSYKIGDLIGEISQVFGNEILK